MPKLLRFILFGLVLLFGLISISAQYVVIVKHKASNIKLIQSPVVNNQHTGSQWNIPLTSTGSGQFAVIICQNYTTAMQAPTDAAGDNFTKAYSLAGVKGEGTHDEYYGNISSGQTAIYINPGGSAYSDCNARIYSGIATSSQLDAVIGAATGNGTTSAPVTTPLTASQYDLAVGECMTGQSQTPGWSALGNWVDGVSGYAGSALGAYSQDILNASASQIFYYVSAASHNYGCALALYTSAVAGSFSGNYPSLFIDFNACTSGQAPTIACLNSSTYQLPGTGWTTNNSFAGFSVTNGFEPTLERNVNVGGMTLTPWTPQLGVSHNENYANSDIQYAIPPASIPSGQTKASWFCYWQFSANSTKGVYDLIGTAGGTEISGLDLCLGTPASCDTGNQEVAYIETRYNGEVGSPFINVSPNTLYWATGLLDTVTGDTEYLSIYTGCPSKCTLLGTSSNTSGGNGGTPGTITWGRNGTESNTDNYTIYFADIGFDWSTATYPVTCDLSPWEQFQLAVRTRVLGGIPALFLPMREWGWANYWFNPATPNGALNPSALNRATPQEKLRFGW
jgi:hypothetical protein